MASPLTPGGRARRGANPFRPKSRRNGPMDARLAPNDRLPHPITDKQLAAVVSAIRPPPRGQLDNLSRWERAGRAVGVWPAGWGRAWEGPGLGPAMPSGKATRPRLAQGRV